MKKFKSPLGIDFAAMPLAAAAVHLLLAVAALAFTAALWLGAAQASRVHAPFGGLAVSENARYVDLPPVLIVAHRDRAPDAALTTVAGLSSSDCANKSAGQAAGEGRIAVNLQ